MWSTKLDALLDRNARFWAPAFASRWCIPASLLLSAAMIIYLVALRLVLMVAMIGGGCIEAALVAEDPALLENGWVLDVIRFSIHYVQIMTLGVLAPCLGSALIAGITLARRKRQGGPHDPHHRPPPLGPGRPLRHRRARRPPRHISDPPARLARSSIQL